MNKKTFVRTLSLVVSGIVLLALAFLYFIMKINVLIALIVTILFIGVLLVVYFMIDSMQEENNKEIENKIDGSIKYALDFAKVGILVYSDDFQITWMSDFFSKNNINHVGEKLLNWIPELQSMLQGEEENTTVVINDEKFEVNKVSNNYVLIFKDITNQYDLNEKMSNDSYVLGMISYDNYDESQVSEDDMEFVNANIKTPVVDYLKKFNVVYKQLKNNRLLLVLNEAVYRQIYDDHFSILKQIRQVSNDANIDVTLSIAFAMGSDNLNELDDTVSDLLEIAQTRGGDQVVVRRIGEDVHFFGGNSEAREKRNKTKVRVNINTIKDLISKANKTIILGHKNADADCIGAAICMSNIVLSLDKPAYIITRSGGIDPMINDVLNKYSDVIMKKHVLINENQALELIDENTLVIMVDHHSKTQSNGAQLLEKAKNVVVIDHHRRMAQLDVDALMFYCEPSASSTCEIVSEFLPYMSKKFKLSEQEANIMYLGILIDTDRFRVRSGIRTFDAAKQLKQLGAEPSECDQLAEEPYNNIIDRSEIIAAGKSFKNDIVISALRNGIYSRSIASQACDMMVRAKEIEAAFVICYDAKDEVMISARSNGKTNVQIVMEKMHGGGHMTAAGLQRKDTTVEQLYDELVVALNEYLKGDFSNESNTTK